MKNKIILYLCMILLCLNIVLSSDVNTLSNGLTGENLTYYIENNYTRYVEVPDYVTIINASMALKSSLYTCIQEFTNYSNSNCTTYNTGNYSYTGTFATDPGNFTDGDWDTFTNTANKGNITIYYQKPGEYYNNSYDYYNNSYWSVKSNDCGIQNISLQPYWDWLPDHIALQVQISTNNQDYSIYNGTVWFGIGNCPTTSRIYEEQIVWYEQEDIEPYVEVGTPDGAYTYYNVTIPNSTYYYNFSSTINTILDNKCACVGCINSSDNCQIPITFYSNATSILSYFDININYNHQLNFSIYDEITKELITDEVNIDVIGSGFAENYTTSTGELHLNLTAYNEYRITYYSDLYTKRDYYITLTEQYGGNIYPVSLYLLSSNNGTDVTFTVQDNTGVELSNAKVKLKRYYIDDNTYTPVAIAKTNAEGQAIIDVDFNDAFYIIQAEYGTDSVSTPGAKIFDTSLTITITTTADAFEELETFMGITTALSYNNASSTFSYIFNNPSGTAVQGILEVNKITPRESTQMCYNTDISSGSTILCTVNVTDNFDSYVARGYIDLQTGLAPILSDEVSFNNWLNQGIANFGQQGVFLSLIMAGTFATLGAASSALSILFFMVGLGAALYFGFSAMALTAYIGIFVLALILIYKLRS